MMDESSGSSLINGASPSEDKCDPTIVIEDSDIKNCAESFNALPDVHGSPQPMNQENVVASCDNCDIEEGPSHTGGETKTDQRASSPMAVSPIDKCDTDVVSLVDIEASLENIQSNGCGNNDIMSEESHQILCDDGKESSTSAVPEKSSSVSTRHPGSAYILEDTACLKHEEASSSLSGDQMECEKMELILGQKKGKGFSYYAILPGELTGQLIEGPSITLPPSELRNQCLADPNRDVHTKTVPESEILCSVQQSENMAQTNSSNEHLLPSPTDDSKPPNLIGTDASTQQQSNKSPVINENSEAKTTISESSSVSSSKPDCAAVTTPPLSNQATVKQRIKKTPHDFIFGKVLGEGSYSTVHLAKEVSTQKEFAIKVCDKKHLIRERKTHFVMREKEVLMKLDHPFFIQLAYTFQDPERLYYVLTYARNGELLQYLHKLSVFDVPSTKFYSAELVLALEYLQSLGIVHRDLKPENILFGDDMHIKITDFGTSKMMESDVKGEGDKKVKRKNSFVGTAEYVSPEVLNNLPANYGTDIWALGCIIYQCLSSSPPFRCGNEYQTFQKIVKLEYEFPDGFHDDAKDLVTRLLVIEPSERLGMRQPEGMAELKRQSFFQGIDWASLPKTTPPKLLPYLPATGDNPEFWGGQEHKTGFDDQRLAEIITGQSIEGTQSPEVEIVPAKDLHEVEEVEQREKITKQRIENPFHPFVEDNLILRQGFIDKRKGLFARKRMLLLTEGPHLYYVDAHNKILKGEIPWSKYLRPEAKNFKIFFVHTPNRTYYLESRNPDAHLWVKQIEDVWKKYFAQSDKD